MREWTKCARPKSKKKRKTSPKTAAKAASPVSKDVMKKNSVKPSSIDHIGEKAVGGPLKETAAPQQSPQQVRGKPSRKSKPVDEPKAVKTVMPESTEIPLDQPYKRYRIVDTTWFTFFN